MVVFDISRSKMKKIEGRFINEKLELKLGFLIFLPPEKPRSIQVAKKVFQTHRQLLLPHPCEKRAI